MGIVEHRIVGCVEQWTVGCVEQWTVACVEAVGCRLFGPMYCGGSGL